MSMVKAFFTSVVMASHSIFHTMGGQQRFDTWIAEGINKFLNFEKLDFLEAFWTEFLNCFDTLL